MANVVATNVQTGKCYCQLVYQRDGKKFIPASCLSVPYSILGLELAGPCWRNASSGLLLEPSDYAVWAKRGTAHSQPALLVRVPSSG